MHMWIGKLVIGLCVWTVGVRGKCADIDTQACVMMQSEQPDLCSNSKIGPLGCPAFCNLCVECYHCNMTLGDSCNTTLCDVGEVCVTRITSESTFELTCGPIQTCEGVEERPGDISESCCTDNLCNIPYAPRPKCVVDLVVVLDESDVMVKDDKMFIYFIQDVTSLLPIGTDAVMEGIVTFAEEASERFDLDDYTNITDIIYAIRDVTFHGGATANVDAGLSYAANFAFTDAAGDRPDVPNVVLLITEDGSRVQDELSEQEKAITAMVDSYIIVEVGKENHTYFGISEKVHLFHIWDAQSLGRNVVSVRDVICP